MLMLMVILFERYCCHAALRLCLRRRVYACAASAALRRLRFIFFCRYACRWRLRFRHFDGAAAATLSPCLLIFTCRGAER